MDTWRTFLRSGTYRLMIWVNGTGAFGVWYQNAAFGWAVYEMTGSAAKVGLVALFLFGPYAAFGLFFTGTADTYSKRTMILLSQVGYALNATVLCAVAFFGALDETWIYAACVFRSLLACIDTPSRLGMTAELVERQHLQRMLSINAGLSATTRIVAPTAAGLIISIFGIQYCFIPNMLTSFSNLIGVHFLTKTLQAKGSGAFRLLDGFVEGFRIILNDRQLAALFGVLLAVGTIPLSFAVIMPVFSSEVLGGDANTFGMLMSCMGIGGLIGSALMAMRPMSVRGTIMAGMGIGLVHVGLYFQTSFIPTAALIIFAGACAMGLIVGATSIVLATTDRSIQGKVGGLFSYVINAIAPLGSVLVGWIIAAAGLYTAFVVGAVVAILAGMIALFAVGQARAAVP